MAVFLRQTLFVKWLPFLLADLLEPIKLTALDLDPVTRCQLIEFLLQAIYRNIGSDLVVVGRVVCLATFRKDLRCL